MRRPESGRKGLTAWDPRTKAPGVWLNPGAGLYATIDRAQLFCESDSAAYMSGFNSPLIAFTLLFVGQCDPPVWARAKLLGRG